MFRGLLVLEQMEWTGSARMAYFPLNPEVFSDVDFLVAEIIGQIPSEIDEAEDMALGSS